MRPGVVAEIGEHRVPLTDERGELVAPEAELVEALKDAFARHHGAVEYWHAKALDWGGYCALCGGSIRPGVAVARLTEPVTAWCVDVQAWTRGCLVSRNRRRSRPVPETRLRIAHRVCAEQFTAGRRLSRRDIARAERTAKAAEQDDTSKTATADGGADDDNTKGTEQ